MLPLPMSPEWDIGNTGRKLLGTKQAPSVPGSMRPATGVLKMGCW
jgi:hypothetical protein